MGFLGDVIGEVIFDGILAFIDRPGAYMHWWLKGRKRPYKEIVERYFGFNLVLSLLVFAVAGLVLYLAF